MKTWLVMRHGKSDWNAGVEDHERPLNKRGKRDGPRMGTFLKKQGPLPDHILSSTAVRARSTAEAVAEDAGCPDAVECVPALYAAEPPDYIEALSKLDDSVECVMTVGHNPVSEELIEFLTGESVTMPTAAVAHLELDLDSWRDLDGDTPARLKHIWRPKELD